ncbi:MAG: hypothetical protein KKA07_17375 [Bacteroidetes bacterium]|nr:hypothetical protein [Bacteroidota bacterium]MBU1720841.1 hypothetical protein [Bacteroidota bacterium]
MNHVYKLTIFAIFFTVSQFAFSQNTTNDTRKTVTATAVFDGNTVMIGNLDPEEVYCIGKYYISVADISDSLANLLKGKKVLVKGKLETVSGKYLPAKTSTDGRIYEPYHEPDRTFLVEPVFKIIDGEK